MNLYLQHADKKKLFTEKVSVMLKQLLGKLELFYLLIQQEPDPVHPKRVLGQFLNLQKLQLSRFQILLPLNNLIINMMRYIPNGSKDGILYHL